MARVIHLLISILYFCFFDPDIGHAQAITTNITFVGPVLGVTSITIGESYQLFWNPITYDATVVTLLFEAEGGEVETLEDTPLQIIYDDSAGGLLPEDGPYSPSCSWTIPDDLVVGDDLILWIYLITDDSVSSNYSDTIGVNAASSTTAAITTSHLLTAPTTTLHSRGAANTTSAGASESSSGDSADPSDSSGSVDLNGSAYAGIFIGSVCGFLCIAGLTTIVLRRNDSDLNRRIFGRLTCTKHKRNNGAVPATVDDLSQDAGPVEMHGEPAMVNIAHEMPE